MILPRRRTRASSLAGLVVLLLATAAPRAAAQLRPIDPVPWDALAAQGPMARVGLAVHADARATLAGTVGTLTELGIYTGTWTTGRVVIEIGGVVTRLFADDSVYADPIAHAHPSDGSRRVDTGEHRFATTVRLTPEASPVAAVMRFGTRLPTTENEEGLGRDQTDFFGGFGARARRGWLEGAGEIGLGILGTRLDRPEQVDVLTYGARVGAARPGARGWIDAVGQHDTRRAAALRGLEDLSEARLVGELGQRRRVRATIVRGMTDASVGWGAVLEGALSF